MWDEGLVFVCGHFSLNSLLPYILCALRSSVRSPVNEVQFLLLFEFLADGAQAAHESCRSEGMA